MDMLNKFHEWLEDKTCRLRGDQQLDRMIRHAYRQVEPPTPADQLRARLLARAENMSQLPPLAGQRITTEPKLALNPTGTGTSDTQKYIAWQQQMSNEKMATRYHSRRTRQSYRQFMDYAMHQMRLNLIDSNIYFI